MTRDEAVKMFAIGWWQEATDDEIVRFQLWEPRLCMPFGRFHEAVERVLGRPVYTHEFAAPANLRAEYNGAPPMSLAEIIDLLPADRTIVIVPSGQREK